VKRIVPGILGFVLLLASCGNDPQSDTTKPVVSLVSSKTSVTAAESIKLTATATDNVGVTKVEFYDGTTKLGEDSSSPYEFDVALTVANNGSRSYKAKAFDAASNEGSSEAVAVTVAIVQTITVTGTVISVNGRASGAKVLLNNGNLQTTDVNGSFTYNSVTVPYSLTVAYADQVFVSEGLTRSDPLTFIVPFAAFGGSFVSGRVTGPTYPLSGRDDIAFGSTGYAASSTERVSRESGGFDAGIEWSPISAITTVDLAALRYTSGFDGSNNLVITDFLKTGKRTGVTLTKGVTQSNLDIALDTPVLVSSATLTYSKGVYRSSNGRINKVTVGGAQFRLSFPVFSGIATKIPSEGGSFVVEGQDTDSCNFSLI
jgi:Bacterial Ig domain